MNGDIVEYAKRYTEFLKTDMTEQQETELMAARNDLIKRGKQTLVTAVEVCATYGQFVGSVILTDFINRTKWLLVDTNDERLAEWEINNPMQTNTIDNSHSIENLTIAIITYFTYEYLKEVEKC